MKKIINFLIFIFAFNTFSQEILLNNDICFKEINFNVDINKLSGFSQPYQDPDGMYVSYNYLGEDGLRDCSEIFGVWFERFTLYQQSDNDVFFSFTKIVDSNTYTVDIDALHDYIKGELTRLLGKVIEIEPNDENGLQRKTWQWEKDGVNYELSSSRVDDEDDINDYAYIEIFIGKANTL